MPCHDCPYTACSKAIDGETYKAKTPFTRLDVATGLLKPLCHNNTAKECDGFPKLPELGFVTTRQDTSNGMMEIEVEILTARNR